MLRPRHARGFTLVELLIVVTILAIVAGIAIPSLMAAKSNANDKAIVATMRAIATAQELARTHALIDTDKDGVGESATLPELAGSVAVRGSGTKLRPPYVSWAMGAQDADGFVTSHGFYFALYLPDASGNGVIGAPASFASVNADRSEHCWTCIAWPVNRATQGYATYFVNQNGDIICSRDARYSGKTSVPPPGCGLAGVAPTQIDSNALAVGVPGADGNTWVPVH